MNPTNPTSTLVPAAREKPAVRSNGFLDAPPEPKGFLTSRSLPNARLSDPGHPSEAYTEESINRRACQISALLDDILHQQIADPRNDLCLR